MPKRKDRSERNLKYQDPPPVDRRERSSPGSGEDEEDGAADLQPDDVGEGDTAR